jgi:predicted nucleic acid-binding protein
LAVVSDSGLLIALEGIEQLQLLPQLFARILIPPAVEKEMTPDRKLPDWVLVQALRRPQASVG